MLQSHSLLRVQVCRFTLRARSRCLHVESCLHLKEHGLEMLQWYTHGPPPPPSPFRL